MKESVRESSMSGKDSRKIIRIHWSNNSNNSARETDNNDESRLSPHFCSDVADNDTNWNMSKKYRRQKRRLRRKRERSSMVLFSIVMLFLVCHSTRFIFKTYDVLIIDEHISRDKARFCHRYGRHSLPPIWFCISNLNELVIVLNSALNFFLYCATGKRFRQELSIFFKQVVQGVKSKLTRRRRNRSKAQEEFSPRQSIYNQLNCK